MQQNKLRVWDKKVEKYVKDVLFFDTDGNGYFLGDLPNSNSGRIGFSPSEFIIEKTTGFYDVKGKELFEGDIVNEIFDGDFVYVDTFKQTKLISVIEQDSINPTLVLHRNNSTSKYDFEYDFSKVDLLKLELIGNIHENSNLTLKS